MMKYLNSNKGEGTRVKMRVIKYPRLNNNVLLPKITLINLICLSICMYTKSMKIKMTTDDIKWCEQISYSPMSLVNFSPNIKAVMSIITQNKRMLVSMLYHLLLISKCMHFLFYLRVFVYKV
jgi:hypothetical protein